MTPGVITGGWEFVWAVYGLSFSLYVIYTTSVIVRWRRDRHRAEGSAHRLDRSVRDIGEASLAIKRERPYEIDPQH